MKTALFLLLLLSTHFTIANPITKDPKELYIDLVKKVLINSIYISQESNYSNSSSQAIRDNGLDWPETAHTMVGLKRLDNIHACLKEILENQIPGDCIETGVWRGGCTILMRAILSAYGDTKRKVWIADSFEGLPPPNLQKYPQDKGLNLSRIKELSVSVEQVKENFRKYDLLDDQCVFLKGFFCDTLHRAPIEKIALLRLDGDLYESTIQALEALYPKVSIGGYIIVDDYGFVRACAQAVNDYRARNGIDDPIIPVDWTGVYWKKTK